ncbi:dihydropteroate synthase [Nitrospira sp.]|nr:dihydropteroate synthase [Nitrospira sp.]
MTGFSIHACGSLLAFDRPQLVGILNVTPDSFSDGGRFTEMDRAVAHAASLIEQGAGILDIGAESTRPGSRPIGEQEETRRLLPVLERLGKFVHIPISVDTTKAIVARRALDAGAVIVNDVSALRFDPAMGPLIAERGAGVILMHMQGVPTTMQEAPSYADVVREVHAFLAERLSFAERNGIQREQIVLDPGFGFGKLEGHNVELLRDFAQFTSLGRPLMAGVSRKSFLGRLSGRPVQDRVWATAAAVAMAIERGASLVRVHDVAAMRDVVSVASIVSASQHEISQHTL